MGSQHLLVRQCFQAGGQIERRSAPSRSDEASKAEDELQQRFDVESDAAARKECEALDEADRVPLWRLDHADRPQRVVADLAQRVVAADGVLGCADPVELSGAPEEVGRRDGLDRGHGARVGLLERHDAVAHHLGEALRHRVCALVDVAEVGQRVMRLARAHLCKDALAQRLAKVDPALLGGSAEHVRARQDVLEPRKVDVLKRLEAAVLEHGVSHAPPEDERLFEKDVCPLCELRCEHAALLVRQTVWPLWPLWRQAVVRVEKRRVDDGGVSDLRCELAVDAL